MDLSIIIVSWNVAEKLRANLRSLFSSKGDFTFEVFVVDNASSDNSAQIIEQEFPQVKLIANQENLGFAKANNQAIKQAQGNFILLLNPDMLVNQDTVNELLLALKGKELAVVGSGRLLDEQGSLIKHVRRFPRLIDQLMIVLKVPHIFPAVLNNYLVTNFNYNIAAKVDSVRGALFLINVAAWQNISGQDRPLLDEQYFIWFEEVDFCRQIHQAGGEVWYFPQATCLDYVGQSFKQLGVNSKQRYFEESMLKYFKKWHNNLSYYILKTAWPLGKFLARILNRNK